MTKNVSSVSGSTTDSGQPHCLVIGAGVVGACCAWHLTAAGFPVTLVDRALPGQATSFGNAACISPSHVVPFSYPGVWKKLPRWLTDPLAPLTIRWRHLPWTGPWLWRFWRAGEEQAMRASAQAQAALMEHVLTDYQDLLSRAGLEHFVRDRGAIGIYDTPAQFEGERWIWDLEAELGYPWRKLSEAELRERVPELSLPGGVAIDIPSWRHTVDPGAMTGAIVEHARKNGAVWRQDAVVRIEVKDDAVHAVTESGNSLKADRVVVAAGAWSNRLAADLDHAVPMTPKRGYHSMIAHPGINVDVPVISGSRGFVMTPLETGLRLAGTAEFARLDAAPDYRRARILVDHARHYLPNLQTEGISEWMGQRPMMSDSVPVISSSPSHSRVYYAFGHGHYGITQGPTTGRLITALMRGEKPDLDLTPYRIDRFE